MDPKARVLIADDHPAFRDGLVKAIERDGEFAIVGQAANGAEALKLVAQLRPDLALLAVSMPVMNGLEVARRIHQEGIPTELVFLTMYKDPVYFNAALDLGVRGYLLRDGVVSELLSCLKMVTDGQYYVSPSISHLLVEREKKAGGIAGMASSLENLTPAELSILRLLAENQTSKEIATKLCVSTRTVENQRTRICAKLGVKGNNELLQFAMENRAAM